MSHIVLNTLADWTSIQFPTNEIDTLRRILDYPPGSPDSEHIYDNLLTENDYSLGYPDEQIEISESICGKGNSKWKDRRKFAAAWGKYAEALTAQYLLKRGLTVREWNWKPGKGKGEIDLIASQGETMIFVEVKARCGNTSDPYDAITHKKIKDICRGANLYLKMQDRDYYYRFDVALLRGDPHNPDFEYIEDAFLPPLHTLL